MIEEEKQICKNIAHINDVKIKICALIAECRIKSGQTQKDVADWCEMSLRSYSDLEKGICTIENLCIVADKFCIELKLNFNIYCSMSMTYHGIHARRRRMTKRGAQVAGPPLRSGVWDGPQRRDTSRTCWRMIECEMNLPLKSPSGSGSHRII